MEAIMSVTSDFWDDLAHDLKDPEFLREYIVESMRIATIDAVVNELDTTRQAAGLSKADLARAIQVEPATIRRLFASARPNPTLGTLAEVAAALGLRITLEPLEGSEREQVTVPLLEGKAVDPLELGRYLEELRAAKTRMPV
jgi:transcriptional regulator with XRE-family HTH domain